MSLDKTEWYSHRTCGECNTILEVWEINDTQEEVQLYCPTCKCGCGYVPVESITKSRKGN